MNSQICIIIRKLLLKGLIYIIFDLMQTSLFLIFMNKNYKFLGTLNTKLKGSASQNTIHIQQIVKIKLFFELSITCYYTFSEMEPYLSF